MTSKLTNDSVINAMNKIHSRHQKEYAKLISRYQIMCETGGACTVDAQIYRKIFKNGKELLKGIEFLNLELKSGKLEVICSSEDLNKIKKSIMDLGFEVVD